MNAGAALLTLAAAADRQTDMESRLLMLDAVASLAQIVASGNQDDSRVASEVFLATTELAHMARLWDEQQLKFRQLLEGGTGE